ncbi:MAG: hypothetical protein IJ086_04365, partial [Clostridium sp.]|nr:hypothetical protein [Clostridium sp.]
SNGFKVNLNDENHVKSRKKIKDMQILITIMLMPIAFSILASTIAYGVSLIASVVAMIVGTPFAISLTRVMPETKMIIIFGFIAYIGLEILMWQLFILVVKLEKKGFKIYTRWLKTNKLYIDGSVKKENMDKCDEITCDNDGGEINE